MAVVLFLLKLIGILLLILLGLLLLLILSVMLIPVRYRIRGKARESIEGTVHISWLMHLLCVSCEYKDNKMRLVLRIFGIPKELSRKESEGDEKPAKRKKVKKKKEKTKKKEKLKKEEKAKKKDTVDVKNRETDLPEPGKKTPSDKKTLSDKKPPSEEKAPSKKNSFSSRQSIFSKLYARIKGIFQKLYGIGKKVKGFFQNIRENAARFLEMLRDEANKSALVLLWRELRILLRHFGPRKVTGNLSFGMGSPELTGQILGGLSMFPFFFRYHIDITPDFETEKFYIKGSFDIKGHIRGMHLLRTGFHLFKDKNLRSLLRQFKTQ